MNGFAAAFSALSECTSSQTADILAIAFCACLCGAESCVDMAEFAEAKEEVLREFLDFVGKTLRGTHDRATGISPLPMVSAFASETRLSLGLMAVDATVMRFPRCGHCYPCSRSKVAR